MKPRPPQITDIAVPSDPFAARARQAVQRLHASGHVAYWAGGCVRDILLARTPKDYDIATNAPPDRVTALFPGSVEVGKAFGVVRVPLADAWFDVATFRQDHAYRDGRRPEGVTFADARKDAMRRDFTINALFCDPMRQSCIDYVGGRADLQHGLVRAVGDPGTRFDDDHLRLLRAVRFAHTLGFAIQTDTAAAIRHAAPLVTRISPERVRDELTRILVESRRPGAALETLDDLGLLAPILPEVAALKGQAQPPEFHPEGDVFTHTVIMLNLMDPPTPHLAFSILLHDIGKPPTAATDEAGRIRFNGHDALGADMAAAILRRLRFPNDDIDAIVGAVRGHMHFVNVPNMRRSTLRTFVGRPHFPLELELHRIDCTSSHGKLDTHARVLDFQRELASEPALPPPLITGRDVMDLGIPEGPEVGIWIKRAYELQLESSLTTRDDALAWLRDGIKKGLV